MQVMPSKLKAGACMCVNVMCMHGRIVALYFTDSLCMEPLTSYLHLHDVRWGQPQYCMEVMRALQAFGRAVHCLQNFYDKLLQVQLQPLLSRLQLLRACPCTVGCQNDRQASGGMDTCMHYESKPLLHAHPSRSHMLSPPALPLWHHIVMRLR